MPVLEQWLAGGATVLIPLRPKKPPLPRNPPRQLLRDFGGLWILGGSR